MGFRAGLDVLKKRSLASIVIRTSDGPVRSLGAILNGEYGENVERLGFGVFTGTVFV